MESKSRLNLCIWQNIIIVVHAMRARDYGTSGGDDDSCFLSHFSCSPESRVYGLFFSLFLFSVSRPSHSLLELETQREDSVGTDARVPRDGERREERRCVWLVESGEKTMNTGVPTSLSLPQTPDAGTTTTSDSLCACLSIGRLLLAEPERMAGDSSGTTLTPRLADP